MQYGSTPQSRWLVMFIHTCADSSLFNLICLQACIKTIVNEQTCLQTIWQELPTQKPCSWDNLIPFSNFGILTILILILVAQFLIIIGLTSPIMLHNFSVLKQDTSTLLIFLDPFSLCDSHLLLPDFFSCSQLSDIALFFIIIVIRNVLVVEVQYKIVCG